jgi:predicted dehydrogenase
MRAMMGEVESLSAFVTQVREDMPPADTLNATLRCANGAFGIFTKTFAAEGPWDNFAHVIGAAARCGSIPGCWKSHPKASRRPSPLTLTTSKPNWPILRLTIAHLFYILEQDF